jgi:outer membrane protein assembly factor BamB
VSDEYIYGLAVSNDWIAAGRSFGITAIDSKTGKVLWKNDFPLDIDSSLVFSQGNLIVADSSSIKVIEKSGKEFASIELNSKGENAKVVAAVDDHIFVMRIPSWILEVYDIQRETMIFDVAIERGGVSISIDSGPKIVYISTTRFIDAYNLITGDLTWELKKSASISTFDSGMLYYYEDLGTEDFGRISAINARDTSDIWSLEIPLGVRTELYNLTVLGDLLIANTDFGLIGIDKKHGNLLWSSESNDLFYAKPLQIGQFIYAKGTTSNMIYAVSPENGNTIGYLSLSASSVTNLSQREYSGIYESGELLVFSYNNVVYAYGR